MDNPRQEEVLLKVNFGGFELKEFIDWANTFTEEEINELKS